MEQKIIPQDANQSCPGVEDPQAGKGQGCEGCPNQTACQSGELKEQISQQNSEISQKMSQISHKLLVLSGKGGVGKSTVSSQLALALANRGYEIGVLDLDLCGPSIPRMMGVEGEEVHQSNEGWDPVSAHEKISVMSIGFLLNKKDDAVIWRGPRKNGLIKQFLTDVGWGKMDFLIIDTPPGTSDEHISITQMLKLDPAKDGAIIVTTPQEISLSDVRKEISFCHKTGTNIIGVVENMRGIVCPCCAHEINIFSANTGGAAKMCQDLNLPLLARVPLDPMIGEYCEQGVYIGEQIQGKQVSKAAIESYEDLVKEVEKYTVKK